LTKAPYLVLVVGVLLMVIAVGASEASFVIISGPSMEYSFVTSGTPLGIVLFVLGWSLIMVAIGLSFGLAALPDEESKELEGNSHEKTP
jgi:uncharacterized RDD family membrane protein YckC